MKSGHNRPDRYSRYVGDLAVAKLVQLAQNDHLAQRCRERLDQSVEKPQIGPAFQHRLGIDRGRRDRVAAFLLDFERDDICRSIALEPAVAGAPHDLQHPALGIFAAIAVEIAKRPQKRFLDGIGSIGIVACEPSREHIGGIEMRQRYRFEAMAPIGVSRLLPLRDLPRFPDIIDRDRHRVETTGTQKATAPSFRATCSESIRQY